MFVISSFLSATLAVTAPPPALNVPIGEGQVTVELTFTDDAIKQMRGVNEFVQLTAHFYGDAKDENDPDLVEGGIFLSRETVALLPRNQKLTIGGSIPADLLARSFDAEITLRADRAEMAGGKGALDCTIATVALEQAKSDGVKIHCKVAEPFRAD